MKRHFSYSKTAIIATAKAKNCDLLISQLFRLLSL